MRRLGYAAAAVALLAAPQALAGTLDDVIARDQLNCGVGEGFPGFFAPDDKGQWHGLDVDFCRALAAAVLGDPDKVAYLPATPAARFAQLQSGQVDLLSRSVTENLTRDASLGLNFVGINFYDGQGFMVPKNLGISSARELDGAAVCTQTGTTTELNLADYFRQNDMTYTPVVFEKVDELLAAFEGGRCDVYTTDKSTLSARIGKMQDPSAYVILPETISKAANGPVVRQDDGQWEDIVRWTRNAWIASEELGITAANVEEMKGSNNPEVRRLLGVDGELGGLLGLKPEWAYNVVLMVGNYGESYERNLGPDGAVFIDRANSLNRLWSDGGLMFSPAFQ